jgi:hypothetical protein
MLEYAPRFLAISGDEALAEVYTSFVSGLAGCLSEDKKAVQRFCHVYQEAFIEYLREKQAQTVERIFQYLQSTVAPDGILLVEGDSDEIYFSALLRLLNVHNLLIKIVDCGGKDGVVSKYRELTNQLPFLGSITAVVDGDAKTQYNELKHLWRIRKYDSIHCLSRKEIEDVFSLAVHTYTLKQCYFRDKPFEIESRTGENSIVLTLKKLLWQRKRQGFGKVVYAKQVVSILQTVQEFPEELIKIGRACLEQAKRRAADVPINQSALGLDQMSRKQWQQLLEDRNFPMAH